MAVLDKSAKLGDALDDGDESAFWARFDPLLKRLKLWM